VNHLEPGQTVLVRMSGAAALAARVDAVGADDATLILLTPPLRPPNTGQSAAVEVTTKRGIVTLNVRVADHDGRGSMRVTPSDDPVQDAPAVQRRDFVRVAANVPVVVRDGGPDGPAHEVFSLNVSGNGLLLSGLSHLAEGDFAWVAIDLEDGSPAIEALVTVVRDGDRGRRAMRIASISARDEQRMVRFSFVQQQRARIARDT
jgi:c-di-GMP-binding flagellar brake protein YcgR